MLNPPPQTDLLILDFDGTFYPFSPAFSGHFSEAAAKTAVRLGAPLSLEEAVPLAAQSYLDHGSSLTVFQKIYGLGVEACHHVFHEELQDVHVGTCQVTAEQLRAFPAPLALLSHSNRPWILKRLREFGLEGVIPNDAIFALEDVGYHYKLDSDEPYRRVLDKIGVAPANAIMVEDTSPNLVPAKTLGMTTIYVTQGRPFVHADHPHIDNAYPDLPSFLKVFIEGNNLSPAQE